MHRLTSLIAAVLLAASLAGNARAADAPPPAADFIAELKASLERGKESKRGIVFHINGREVAGVVRQVLGDAVIVANQEHRHIVIRLDRIDAIAMD